VKKMKRKSSSWQKGTSKSFKTNIRCSESRNIRICQTLTSKNFNVEPQWFDNTRRQVLINIQVTIYIPCYNLDISCLFKIFLITITWMWIRVYASYSVDHKGTIFRNKLWIKNPLKCKWKKRQNSEMW
jgi:hypothetical protein